MILLLHHREGLQLKRFHLVLSTGYMYRCLASRWENELSYRAAVHFFPHDFQNLEQVVTPE